VKVRSESFATAAKKSLNSIIKYLPIEQKDSIKYMPIEQKDSIIQYLPIEQKVFRVPVGVKVVLF